MNLYIIGIIEAIKLAISMTYDFSNHILWGMASEHDTAM